MGKFKTLLALAAAGSMIVSVPAAAAGKDVESATTLRRLDMMLMVTSLRCRFGADDFRVEYDAFRVRHMPTLRDAALLVTADLSRKLGQRGATDAFDRMSVAMANHYGTGHPGMSCAELKRATGDLRRLPDSAALLAAADRLLDPADNAVVMVARR